MGERKDEIYECRGSFFSLTSRPDQSSVGSFPQSDSPGMSGSRARPESQAMGITTASGGRRKTVRVRLRESMKGGGRSRGASQESEKNPGATV